MYIEQLTPSNMTENLDWIRRSTLHLGKRDYSVLKFLVEMKVATRRTLKDWVDVHIDTDAGIRGLHNRLLKLEKEGFIRSDKIPGSSKSFYRVTKKGHKELAKESIESIPSFRSKLAIGEIHHDLTLSYLRCVFLKSGLAREWISENQIRSKIPFMHSWKREFLPDAIYTSIDGQIKALELEIAMKSGPRYRAKIKKYLKSFRQLTLGGVSVSHTHYICAHQEVQTILEENTENLKAFFTVESLDVYC